LTSATKNDASRCLIQFRISLILIFFPWCVYSGTDLRPSSENGHILICTTLLEKVPDADLAESVAATYIRLLTEAGDHLSTLEELIAISQSTNVFSLPKTSAPATGRSERLRLQNALKILDAFVSARTQNRRELEQSILASIHEALLGEIRIRREAQRKQGRSVRRSSALTQGFSKVSGSGFLRQRITTGYYSLCYVWSPDSRRLATRSDDLKSVWLWDPVTGRRIETVSLSEKITSLAFSHDSKVLVIGGIRGLVYLYEVGSQLPPRVVDTSLKRSIVSAFLAPDRERIVFSIGSGIHGEHNYVLNMNNSTQLTELDITGPFMHFDPERQLALSGRLTSPTGSHAFISFYSWIQNARLSFKDVRPILNGIVAVAPGFSSYLRHEDTRAELRLIHPETGSDRILESIDLVWDPQRLRFAYSNNGHHFVRLVDGNRTLKIWNLLTETSTSITATSGANISSLAISDDGETIAIGASDGRLTLLDARDGKVLFSQAFKTGNLGIRALELSPNGSFLTIQAHDTLATVYDLDALRSN
jgi:WD40 repeat protein